MAGPKGVKVTTDLIVLETTIVLVMRFEQQFYRRLA